VQHDASIPFMLGRQPKRLATSVFVSAAFDAAILFLVLFLARSHAGQHIAALGTHDFNSLVWVAEPGPGGGGGGGGNRTPDPPKPAEHRGADAVTQVVVPPAPIDTSTFQPVPTVQAPEVPAQSLSASVQDLPGAVAAPASPTLSLGSGIGGGAGTGNGKGNGPGDGSGIGTGSGGGSNGGYYQAGNGVTSPVPTYRSKPSFTADAIRAKIQGTALLSCVVTPDGVCTDVQIVRSLDSKYGLDLEAIKSVKLWRWQPGTRLGQKVAVKVLCEIEFSIR
jgi:protein TonB